MARRIAREEGLLVGAASGTAAVAATRLAQTLGPDAVVVVVFPDSGRGYLSTIYDDRWMRAHDYLGPRTGATTLETVLRSKPASHVRTIDANASVGEAIELMRTHAVPYLPVMREGAVAGSIDEPTLLRIAFEQSDLAHVRVGDVMGRPYPVLDSGAEVTDATALLMAATPAVLVTSAGSPRALLTRHDLAAFLSIPV